MKISMWMIADGLAKYDPDVRIRSGVQSINGIRLFSGDIYSLQNTYVYIGNAAQIVDDPKFQNSVIIVHHYDMILIHNQNTDTIINEVLAIFDRYNSWESALWEVIPQENAVQKILDVSESYFKGPVYLMDQYGTILAHTQFHTEPREDPQWEELCANEFIPLYAASSPFIDTAGNKHRDIGTTPNIYYLDTGTKLITALVLRDNEPVLSYTMHEYRIPISQLDFQVAQIVCNALASAVRNSHLDNMLSSNAILQNLLLGKEIDESIVDTLLEQRQISKPWQIVSIYNLQTDNPQKIDMMLSAITRFHTQTIGTVFEQKVVILVSGKFCEALLREINIQMLSRNLCLGVSLPFYSLKDVKIYYDQACYAISQSNLAPGIYKIENYAQKQLMHLLRKACAGTGLYHPALAFLRSYDESHKTELYHTLKVYLFLERNALRTTEFLKLHRNTTTKRLEKIFTLLPDLDLNDESTRHYLTVSFLLSEAELS